MNNTQEKKQLLTFSVTAEQAAVFIPILQDEIVQIGQKQTEALGFTKEAEREWLKFKKESDLLTDMLKSKKTLLENILRQTGRDKNANNLMRSGTHATTGISRQIGSGGIQWSKEFTIILKTENRFMTWDELWNAYFKRYPNLNKEAFKGKFNSQKANMIATAKNTMQQMQEKTPFSKRLTPFVLYKEKHFGLPEWVNDEIVPYPQYIKQFMFKAAS